jgi:predicted nuclease of predicted toxin-antitoxin system
MRRIVIDQGLPATAAKVLRGEEFDAVHVREIGMHAADDTDILELASRESRVVITLDRDFPQILALTAATRPSVVLIRQQRLRTPELAEIIASIWRDYADALEQGCVLIVRRRGTRVRLLPLK